MSEPDEIFQSFDERFQNIEKTQIKDYIPSEYKEENRTENKLPNESLLIIIREVARFVSLKDILELLLLNKHNKKHLLDESLYAYICCRILKYTSAKDLTEVKQNPDEKDPNDSYVLTQFVSLIGIGFKRPKRPKDLFKSIKHSTNLIKNPSFENELNCWQIKYGGSRIKYENVNHFKDRKAVLMISNDSISQEIDLPGGVQRLIVAGVATNRRLDCGSSVTVTLQVDENVSENTMVLPAQNPNFDVFEWVVVKTAYKLDAGTYKVKVTFAGQDEHTEKENGSFGTRFGYCFLYAFDHIEVIS